MVLVKEGAASITVRKPVFYNPEMELCRDVSSLAVGAICTEGSKLNVLDAMCASGIRGIRYVKENENIASVLFLDSSPEACALAKKNVKANKLKKMKVVEDEVNHFLACSPKSDFDLIELDPFGTPAPFLHAACFSLRNKPRAYLSITATDTAVLCGAHSQACLKNYQAHPIDNEFCHELAARILLGKLARTASDFSFGISPLFTLSKLHYIKLFVQLDAGAAHAVDSMQSLGYISYCAKCLNREWRAPMPAHLTCTRCKTQYEHAGPLWLGALWNKETLESMTKLNHARRYKNKVQIDSLLATILAESALPPTYFDLHRISKRLGVSAVSPDRVIELLRKSGFQASKTHFQHNCVRTDAKIVKVNAAVRKVLSQPRPN
ncbi:MAG: tRNA (guanine(10)-N(2))-dimethyltransferase [Candidatus Burarchaeum sp.]|nr:tRNA (guanine(10)-N(2))-dimethyltransferase [Candidatus Burarchaeum sp.]MDO8339281.1 tRNA (guanine(10)-N(2))-dimethyltransferase [Candidatus Burarchaeum sp.]